MRILRICAKGLPAFEKEKVDIDLITRGKVMDYDRDRLLPLEDSDYLFTNNVIGFAGINASGKTTVLMLMSFVLRLISNQSINGADNPKQNDLEKVFRNFKTADFTIYLLSRNNEGLKLCTQVKYGEDGNLIIINEKLHAKNVTKSMSKKILFEFNDSHLFLTREDMKYLPDDSGIMIVLNRDYKEKLNVVEYINNTNYK